MTTVGYGDLSVVNNTEKMVAMFAMIVGGACFGYIIGGVTSILENLNLPSTMHNEKMDAVKEYLYDRQYPPVLATLVKNHFKHLYATEGVFDMMAVLETLPASTAFNLVYTCYNDLIHGSTLLRHTDRDFIVAIIPSLFPCTAADGEFLFFEGSIGTHLFLINSGMISILKTSENGGNRFPYNSPSEDNSMETNGTSGIACGTRGVGQLLGDVAIMLTFTNPFSAYVSHKSELYSIQKEALVEALDIHETTRINFLKVATETHQHFLNHFCSDVPIVPLKGAGAPPCPENEYTDESPEPPIIQTAVESICGPDKEPQSQRAADSRLGVSETAETMDTGCDDISTLGETLASISRSATMRIKCKDDVVPYIEMASRSEKQKTKQNKMVHLIPVAEQKKIEQEALDCFRAVDDAKINTGFEHDNESKQKITIQDHPSNLWSEQRVIHPELPEKVVWDVTVCVLIIYSIVAITYTISFGVEERACSWPENAWTSKLPRPIIQYTPI